MHGQIDRTLSMLTYIRYNVSAMSGCLLFAAAEQQPEDVTAQRAAFYAVLPVVFKI